MMDEWFCRENRLIILLLGRRRVFILTFFYISPLRQLMLLSALLSLLIYEITSTIIIIGFWDKNTVNFDLHFCLKSCIITLLGRKRD